MNNHLEELELLVGALWWRQCRGFLQRCTPSKTHPGFCSSRRRCIGWPPCGKWTSCSPR